MTIFYVTSCMKAFDTIGAPLHACYATGACSADAKTNVERKAKHTSNIYLLIVDICWSHFHIHVVQRLVYLKHSSK